MKKDFRSYYDWTAPIYDVQMEVAAFIDGVRARKERDNFIDCLELKPDQRVLEIGVGTGINLPLVARQIGIGGMTLGLDLSIPMLKQGRKRLFQEKLPARLIGGNAECLPFKSNFFDAVFIFGCFNLLANREGTVREMLRVARVGALIVISDKMARQGNVRLHEKLIECLDPNLTIYPPVDTIPLPRAEIQTDWMWKNMMFVFKFRNPAA